MKPNLSAPPVIRPAKPAAPVSRIGYSLSVIDHDEISWSVERLREGATVWGSGSDVLADGCATSKSEAVEAIKAALAAAGSTLETAVRLPF